MGAEVFRFAAWDGGGSNADWLLPAPGFLEELTDVPTAPTLAADVQRGSQSGRAGGRKEERRADSGRAGFHTAGGGESHSHAL